MLKVWIVGSEGQIGEAINEVLDPLEIEVLNTDKNALDITETDEVLHFGEINRPDVIINCAAITDVELCEKPCSKKNRGKDGAAFHRRRF